ncbi:MAG: ComF family protein, partial [Candidatus Limnocylindria bacterium]
GSWLCRGCRDGLEPLSVRAGATEVRAAGAHAGPLRHAIHRFKYRDERGLALELGGLLADLLAADMARGRRCDALVPVPLHPDRARTRGYDQTALLAEAVARTTGVGVLPAVRRIRHGRPQMELDRSERAASVDGAFVGCAGSLSGMRVAVIDDVATTGATCAAVATAARACGARSVRAYVVAVDE